MGESGNVNELKRSGRLPEFHQMGFMRERSFVRPPSQFQMRDGGQKRRSMHGHGSSHHHNQQQRGKPSLEIYRPPNVRVDLPNKLNVHAKEFTMAMGQAQNLQTSRSNINLSYNQGQFQHGLQHSKSTNIMGMRNQASNNQHHVSNQIQARQITSAPLMNSASAHIIQNSPKVHFKLESTSYNSENIQVPGCLQRSKSMSAADNLTRSLAAMGIDLGTDVPNLGVFPPEIEDIISKASADPNQLSARSLIDLSNNLMQRAVESQKYALPAARLCINVIARETRETFLETLINTCRQWYQERDKILRTTNKSKSRTRFTAFMAFLMEMFSQLKRRQLQLKTQCDGVPPPMVLLTLLCKCCEECVKAPISSLTEIECLFFVLTCIGRDLEIHMPSQLDKLLSQVRDAFLNASMEPGIRRTLLQLIELQASHWQLPGPTVLYYYPSTK